MTRDEILGLRTVGVIAMQNVNLVDRSFGVSTNTIADYCNAINTFSAMSPVNPDPVVAAAGTAAEIVKYGTVLTANDLLVPIRFNGPLFNGILTKEIPVVGYIVSQRFTDNDAGSSYNLQLRYLQAEGTSIPAVSPTIFTGLNRDIQVEPTGGANSVSEFMIIPMTPAATFNYDTAAKEYGNSSLQSQSYLAPNRMSYNDDPLGVQLGLTRSLGMIFKGQVAVSQNVTVTPVIAHLNATDVMLSFFESMFNRK